VTSDRMGVTILVIDDDMAARLTVQRILEATDFRVVTAQNGREGLKLFRAHRPALVITNIIMPEQEGLETILQIRRERPDAKIIAMSGGGHIATPHFLDIARHFGAAGTLAKPFELEQLLASVRAVLNEK
jgi:two-component system, chemotaxis family, chemotaxis protein CheY